MLCSGIGTPGDIGHPGGPGPQGPPGDVVFQNTNGDGRRTLSELKGEMGDIGDKVCSLYKCAKLGK